MEETQRKTIDLSINHSTTGLNTIIKTREYNANIDAKDADGSTRISLTTRDGDTKITTNMEVKEEICMEHQCCFLQDGKPIRMHTEDAANGYTREEIYGRVTSRPRVSSRPRPHVSSRPKTKGNNYKVTANNNSQTPPLSPGDKGQDAEGSTNIRTNKTTKSIAEKKTATDIAVTFINVINTTPKAPNLHRQNLGKQRETCKQVGSLPNDLVERHVHQRTLCQTQS